jgi:hypothetical protein
MNFSAKVLQVRTEWGDIIKELKGKIKKYQTRILYPTKISFRSDKEIKYFPVKQKFREFIITILASQEMLMTVLEVETKVELQS